MSWLIIGLRHIYIYIYIYIYILLVTAHWFNCFIFSVQMLRGYSNYQTRFDTNKLMASWTAILERVLSTISSSFLCLSIIMVSFHWLISKQLRLVFFRQIYIHWKHWKEIIAFFFYWTQVNWQTFSGCHLVPK